jgi:chemotaxis family two-component system response regulator Rcp1
MTTNNKRSDRAHIILAEDDRTIARLTEIALHRTGFKLDLDVVHDGEEAIAALKNHVPDLLLLDLYMPRKDGFEVLQHVKQNADLRRLPVVMFSSSDRAADINRAYDLHANAYVMKQPDLLELCSTMEALLGFWLKTAKVPCKAC